MINKEIITLTEKTIPKKLLSIRTLVGGENIASSVYGTIISIAVIGAWYADPTSGSLETLLSVLATLLVFWVAHAYAHIVAHELPKGSINRIQVISAFKNDWPIVQSGFFPLLILGMGSLDFIGERHSLLFAIAACSLLLTFFCLVMARAANRSWFQSIILTMMMVSLGILVAILEIRLG